MRKEYPFGITVTLLTAIILGWIALAHHCSDQTEHIGLVVARQHNGDHYRSDVYVGSDGASKPMTAFNTDHPPTP